MIFFIIWKMRYGKFTQISERKIIRKVNYELSKCPILTIYKKNHFKKFENSRKVNIDKREENYTLSRKLANFFFKNPEKFWWQTFFVLD